MNRRRFVALAAGALGAPLAALAQKSDALPRVGLLWIRAAGTEPYIAAFREGMRAQGYVEGKNIVIDERFMVERYDGLVRAVEQLARERVSIIVIYGSTAAEAAKKAAPGIPTVMVAGGDPVKLGFASSLARPGGNMTGIASISSDLSDKRLELLLDIAPAVRRLAVLLYPGSSGEAEGFRRYESAAKARRLELRRIEVRSPDEIESAIGSIGVTDAQAVIVIGSTMFNANRRRVLSAISNLRLPAIYASGEYVDDGGLVAYSANLMDSFRRAAVFVDKILKGAKAGDIPIEQPTRFELAVNIKTAKALGLKIPQSVLVRADRVIE